MLKQVPLEIWTEILAHIELLDKISLLRSCRFFKELLLSKQTKSFCHLDFSQWASARSNDKISQILQWILDKDLYLISLNLDGFNSIPEFLLLRVIQKNKTTLKHLSLAGKRVDKQNLDIYSIDELVPAEHGNEQIQCIPLSILQEYGGIFEYLSVAFRPLYSTHMAALITNCTRLQHLDVRLSIINPDELNDLFMKRGPHLQTLKLSHVKIFDLALICFKLYCKNISDLHLDTVFPRDYSSTKICTMVKNLPLKSLHLSHVQSMNLDVVIKELDNPHLYDIHSLWIIFWKNASENQNTLSALAFTVMSSSLSFRHLSDLKLSNACWLRDEDLAHIIMARKSTLRYLDIRKCPLVGLESFKAVIQGCSRLEEWIWNDLEKCKLYKDDFEIGGCVLGQLKILSLVKSIPKSMKKASLLSILLKAKDSLKRFRFEYPDIEHAEVSAVIPRCKVLIVSKSD